VSNPYKLPSYRHVTVDGHPARAYLVLSADVHGTWGAAYHAWLGSTPGDDDLGQYVIVDPVINEAPDIRRACRRLAQALVNVVD
jgi:hypothetical protein